jgi:hypothetical protein
MALSTTSREAASEGHDHHEESIFTTFGAPTSARHKWFADGIADQMRRHGFEFRPGALDEARIIFNLTDIHNPQSFRRKAQAQFSLAVVEDESNPAEMVKAAYPVMVRSLSNVIVYLTHNGDLTDAHFVTMEQGHYVVSQKPGQTDEEYFAEVYERIEPLATSHLVINNIYNTDLPKSLWNGNEVTRQLTWAGEELDRMNLLPAPWPVEELLSGRDLRHVKRLYGIGGLSYGNLSARESPTTFWMSASGVNKAKLLEIGRDILLVTDYDAKNNAMVLSVPPNVKPRRVSVDAIEHFMIYKEHPAVGAIIHVHAWIPGIASTHINYPCGTAELASAVSDLVRQSPDPSRAVVGQKNHGMTITGHSLPEIFERVGPKIVPQVPMS